MLPLPRARLVAVLFGVLATTGLAAIAPAARAEVIEPRPGEIGVGFLFGTGWYENTSFNQRLVDAGIPPIENGFEYGIQVRRRMSRWWSLGLEVDRLDGRSNTSPNDAAGIVYSIAGTPVVAEIFVHPGHYKGFGLDLFGGGGVLAAARVRRDDGATTLDGKKTGTYLHAGAEGELRIGPNFGFFIRGLWRKAEASDINLTAESGDPTAIFDIDFNGTAISFGPRWYFGSEPPSDDEDPILP
jgi:hypothetical protein